MARDAGAKSFDCVKSIHEILGRISAEIPVMTCSELSGWPDERMRKDHHLRASADAQKQGRLPVQRAGVIESASSRARVGLGNRS